MFFSTSEFDKQWEIMGLSMEDRRRLENEIVNNPQIGAVMSGTGGLRKMRFAPENSGKSGGVRALYVDYVVFERVYLVTAYPKSNKENITPTERKLYKKIIEQTEKELGGNKK
ncbi:MAG: type II toxin-antitoxin system RelE/ParE family toxin [Oscillospiraceae bacterium]|nr:type II toxin-antitoxin system RelE/ParE family toxin [Oscillospiraceae bacterium]